MSDYCKFCDEEIKEPAIHARRHLDEPEVQKVMIQTVREIECPECGDTEERMPEMVDEEGARYQLYHDECSDYAPLIVTEAKELEVEEDSRDGDEE